MLTAEHVLGKDANDDALTNYTRLSLRVSGAQSTLDKDWIFNEASMPANGLFLEPANHQSADHPSRDDELCL